MGAGIFIIFGVIIIPLLIGGVFLLNGKGAFLISGYNTMSKADKAKYNERALCRFVGWLVIDICFSMFLMALGIYLETVWLHYLGIALVLVSSLGGVAYANTGNRFLNPGQIPPKSSKTTIIIVGAVSVIILVLVGGLLFYGTRDPGVNIRDNSVQITGMYGLTVEFSEITDISLIDRSMSELGPGRRVNGYGGVGEALKGHFVSSSLGGSALLFVQSKSSPTIHIERERGSDIYISLRDGIKTEELYNQLKAVPSY